VFLLQLQSPLATQFLALFTAQLNLTIHHSYILVSTALKESIVGTGYTGVDIGTPYFVHKVLSSANIQALDRVWS
jgi:hypothetical protein